MKMGCLDESCERRRVGCSKNLREEENMGGVGEV